MFCEQMYEEREEQMIDRKKYLQMCQRCSALPNGICGIKESVPDNLKVVYDGIVYYPQAYKLSFDNKGQTIHTAILHDLKANSITKCKLERVEKYEQSGSNSVN